MTSYLSEHGYDEFADPECRLDGARFVISGRTARIVVDCRDHDIVLGGAGRPERLAATRFGLNEAIRRVGAAVNHALAVDVIESYIMDALVLAAREANSLADEAFTTVDLIWRTPLVLSRGVVSAPHLLDDVVRFRAAAVAVTRIEEEVLTDATVPERAELWAWQLRRWRELYCAPGSVQRSVNRTLAQFGDEASADALWGLRAVVLAAPLPSVQHVEVLGCLGARQRAGAVVPPELHEAVLRASSQELGTALVMIDEGLERVPFGREAPAMRLAEILSIFSLEQLRADLDRRIRFEDLLTLAIHALRDVLKLDAETIRPPIPLPTAKGVTFLGNVADIMQEGVEMDHCVATRAPKALAGQSYIFRIRAGGYRATVEVGSDGVVLEARGPGNEPTPAVGYAEHVLGCWAAPLRFAGLGEDDTPLSAVDAPNLPKGLEPIMTLGALRTVVTALTTPVQDNDEHVIAWALDAAAQAKATARGDKGVSPLWLAVQRVAGVPFELWSVDESGTALTSTILVRESAPARPAINLDDDELDRRLAEAGDFDEDMRTPVDPAADLSSFLPDSEER